MWPVLFSVFGIQIQSYGVSKALAALVAAWLLGRAFRRLGQPIAQVLLTRDGWIRRTSPGADLGKLRDHDRPGQLQRDPCLGKA